jgi:hypothetical protein
MSFYFILKIFIYFQKAREILNFFLFNVIAGSLTIGGQRNNLHMLSQLLPPPKAGSR